MQIKCPRCKRTFPDRRISVRAWYSCLTGKLTSFEYYCGECDIYFKSNCWWQEDRPAESKGEYGHRLKVCQPPDSGLGVVKLGVNQHLAGACRGS